MASPSCVFLRKKDLTRIQETRDVKAHSSDSRPKSGGWRAAAFVYRWICAYTCRSGHDLILIFPLRHGPRTWDHRVPTCRLMICNVHEHYTIILLKPCDLTADAGTIGYRRFISAHALEVSAQGYHSNMCIGHNIFQTSLFAKTCMPPSSSIP